MNIVLIKSFFLGGGGAIKFAYLPNVVVNYFLGLDFIYFLEEGRSGVKRDTYLQGLFILTLSRLISLSLN